MTHNMRHVVPPVTPKFRTVYEMRDTQCHTCARTCAQFCRDNSRHLGENFEHFKIFATTWHALLHLTRIATHPHAHCHSQVLPSLARQIACHCVNRLSCQCEACLICLVKSNWFKSRRGIDVNTTLK